MPQRDIISGPVATRAGDRYITSEWRSKEIEIKGRIFGNTSIELRQNIDDFQQALSIENISLFIDTDRYYTAVLESIDIPTQFYNATMVTYDAKFYCPDPFAYSSYTAVSGNTISGTLTYSGTVTISGTVYAEPSITITPRYIQNGLFTVTASTGELVTLSGTFSPNNPVILDYRSFRVTNSGIASDFTGVFSRWEPGSNSFTINFSGGINAGYSWKLDYQPRYFA